MFLATEAGLNHLSAYQIPITSWSEFCEACGLIASGEHNFRTVVIDTVDILYKLCDAHVLEKNRMQHASDAEWGKGWDLINREFQRILTALSLLPYGLIMTSHAVEKEVKTPTGKAMKIFPTMPNSARKIVLGMCDLILYAEMVEIVSAEGVITGYDRVLRTKPTTLYEAGDRTGKLPETLPMRYEAFAAATVETGVVIEDPATGKRVRAKTNAKTDTNEEEN